MDFFSFLLAFLIVGLSIYFIILHSSNHKDSSKSTKQNSASVKSQPLNSKNQQDLKANETSSKLFEDNTPQMISTPKEEEKINESKTESSSENIILKEIYFYPIKSCRGISVKKAKIDRFGIMYDRAWLIVDVNAENHGKFLTQRTHPKLALIETKIEDETLFIKTPTQPELKIPIPKVDSSDSKILEVEVWDSLVNAIDEGDKVASYFQKFLETSSNIRLVRRMQTHNRKVPSRWSKIKHGLVGFADAFPFLLASEESRRQISEWAGDKDRFSIKRFRPNLVVEGLKEPFEEDNWKTVRIGSIKFEVAKKCTRCKIPTVDPDTGIPSEDQEPLTTLHKYREGLLFGGKEVCFGQNLVHENFGEIEVGQTLQVLE